MFNSYNPRGGMFKDAHKSKNMLNSNISGNEVKSIWGFDNFKNGPGYGTTVACCTGAPGPATPSSPEKFELLGFYPSIWPNNKKFAPFTNQAFGEECCEA